MSLLNVLIVLTGSPILWVLITDSGVRVLNKFTKN